MNKNIVIIILSVVIVGLCGFIAYDKLLNKKSDEKVSENQTQNETNEKENYKEYKTLENIELKDGSKWVVIKNSDSKSDYVTAVSKEVYDDDIQEETFDELSNELFNSEKKVDYNNSKTKKYVDSIANKLNVKLKEVDGYTIRLLKLEDIFEIDNKFTYDKEKDTYDYTGTLKLSDFLSFSLTMSPSKCTEGKCLPFYNVSQAQCYNDDEKCNNTYYIEHWQSGVGGIRPVINVYKTEIK